MTEKPQVVWQRGKYRVVAVDDPDEGKMLFLEERLHDAMGGDCWLHVLFDEDVGSPVALLVHEVVSRVDVVPPWVRAFVRETLKAFDEEVEEDGEGGGAA